MVPTRVAKYGVRALELAKLLEKAGWEWRRGHGDHVVISKEGEQSLTLADPISLNQWKGVERVLGLAIHDMIGGSVHHHGRRGMSQEEWRQRFGLALNLRRVGFPDAWVMRQASLRSITTHHPTFTPAVIESLGVEEAVQRYTRREASRADVMTVPIPTTTPPPHDSPPDTPHELVEALRQHDEPHDERHDSPLAPADDNVNAFLDLLQGVKDDVQALSTGSATRAAAYAERLRLLQRRIELLKYVVVQSLDTMLSDLQEG